jgi:hypothetical protein
MAQEHLSPFGNRQSEVANGPYTGPSLTPWQYEALCRHALSREYGIPLHEIKTGYLESPSKGNGTRAWGTIFCREKESSPRLNFQPGGPKRKPDRGCRQAESDFP